MPEARLRSSLFAMSGPKESQPPPGDIIDDAQFQCNKFKLTQDELTLDDEETRNSSPRTSVNEATVGIVQLSGPQAPKNQATLQ